MLSKPKLHFTLWVFNLFYQYALEVVVERGVEVEAVRPVREPEPQVRGLCALEHFYHKVSEKNHSVGELEW